MQKTIMSFIHFLDENGVPYSFQIDHGIIKVIMRSTPYSFEFHPKHKKASMCFGKAITICMPEYIVMYKGVSKCMSCIGSDLTQAIMPKLSRYVKKHSIIAG